MNLIGQTIPDFSLQLNEGQQTQFSEFRGKWVVLYFYPKDATPGCTLEGQNFRDTYPLFLEKNAIVLGVSRDSLASHARFCEKQNFPFSLISDQDEVLCLYFDVIKQKSMYGKLVRGIERSTFLISPEGIVVYEWRKVKVSGHVDEVLNVLEKSGLGRA